MAMHRGLAPMRFEISVCDSMPIEEQGVCSVCIFSGDDGTNYHRGVDVLQVDNIPQFDGLAMCWALCGEQTIQERREWAFKQPVVDFIKDLLAEARSVEDGDRAGNLEDAKRARCLV